MKTETKIKNKSKQHTIYKTSNGDRVPGVTTITGVENKRALVPWANKLGLQGIDSSKYVDDLASVGTLAHYMAECYIKGETPNLDNNTPNEIDLAENAMIKFYDWVDTHAFELIASEQQLVSDIHGFGGTCDIYCILDGIKTLIDLKTSKALYTEMGTQVSAYEHLLKENGFPVFDVRILRIGRSENEGFEEKHIFNRQLHFKKFLALKSVYDINKQLRKLKNEQGEV